MKPPLRPMRPLPPNGRIGAVGRPGTPGMAAPQASSADDPQRLSKVVAALVPCSRREAEQYIAEGWVRVDGRRGETPQQRVVASQRVEVDPQARLQHAAPATFVVHKPAGAGMDATRAQLIESRHWSGDTSGIRPSAAHRRVLQPLLPLPSPASGLCIFSQDPRVLRKLTEDAALVEQELLADVAGTLAPGGLQRLCHGLRREEQLLPPARVSWQSEARLRFAVKGIAPDWIPWMCAQVGLELLALRRIRVGRVPMAGLPVGQWRYLQAGERF